MKNQRLAERKQELKELTLDIRKAKPYSDYLSHQFRYKHIAYCMARGRSYEQIESKVHEHNIISKYDWERINSDIDYLKEGFCEDVCASA